MYDKEENIYDFRPYRAAYSPEFLQRVAQRREQKELAEHLIAEEKAERKRAAEEKLFSEERAQRALEHEKHAQEMEQVNELLDKYRELNIIDCPKPERPSAKSILYQVANVHRVTVAEILGNRRDHFTVRARFAAVRAVADARPDLTLTQIGRVFERDHTSILHALKATAKPDEHHRRAIK